MVKKLSLEEAWKTARSGDQDFNEQKVVVQKPQDSIPKVLWSDINYDINKMYVQQLKCFIKYVEEGRMKHSNDIQSGIKSLQVVESLFRSDKKKEIIKISDNKKFKFD